jgi:hypothetical protein
VTKSPPAFSPNENITLTPFSSPEKDSLSSTNGQNGHSIDATASIKPKRQKSSAEIEALSSIGQIWNELASILHLPQIDEIKGKREANTLARMKDLVLIYGFSDAIAGFRELCNKIRGSPFLRGEVTSWRCNFDFVVTSSSFMKIMDGNYADTGKKTGQFSGIGRH